jgi:hypothetical protein
MLLNVSITALAGDENNPEITDEEDDLFGPWAKPEDMDKYDYLDIISAWFTENPDEPDYLYLYSKVKDFKFEQLRAIYAMHWEFEGAEYSTGTHTHTYGDYQVFIAGISRTEYFTINGDFDEENNIVFFKVPKSLVGYPQQGDVLTQTDAWNALRTRMELLTLLSGDGELIKDWAGYGRDYIIQYDCLGVPYMHRLFGETVVTAGTEAICNFEATDPQGEDVYFYVDWGDGTIDEWVGPYPSDEPIVLSHAWNEHGSSIIKAKARDINGYESEIAELVVSVVKSRAYESLFSNIFARYPFLYQIIRLLFKI